MGSSGAAMNGITVPARNACSRDCERGNLALVSAQMSVDGLSDLRDIRVPGLAQPVIVMLQMFDQGLQIANSRSESCTLKDQTIVPIHPLTQQRLGHTNSVEILRACEGRWTLIADAFTAASPLWGTPRVSPASPQVNVTD
jgi:hypothetical protein